jgi:hypothetical protein
VIENEGVCVCYVLFLHGCRCVRRHGRRRAVVDGACPNNHHWRFDSRNSARGTLELREPLSCSMRVRSSSLIRSAPSGRKFSLHSTAIIYTVVMPPMANAPMLR